MLSSSFVLKIVFVSLFWTSTVFAGDWSYLYCHHSETGEAIELEMNLQKKLTLKTKESVFLLYQMPCQGVSEAGPFVRCNDNFGSESRSFFSFSRIENGFTNAYSAELFDELIYYFTFERSYQDASGQYRQLNREFKFKKSDCAWE